MSRARSTRTPPAACLTALALAVLSTINSARAELGQQRYKLTASDAASLDLFGDVVAVSGNLAVVGAENHDVNGNSDQGAAYLFDATTGQQLFELTAADGLRNSRFGSAVAVDGETMLIGASHDDYVESNVGAVYVFSATTGKQVRKIHASNPGENRHFGSSVSLDGQRAIVGAVDSEDYGRAYILDVSTGAELHHFSGAGEFGYSVGISEGKAIIGTTADRAYVYDVFTGDRLLTLRSIDEQALPDHFGKSVAISGNIALVGAPGQSLRGTASGAAYIIDVNSGQLLHRLVAADPGALDVFGFSVAISGNSALVGAYQNDDFGSNSGAAYLFDVTTGQQIRKLTAADGAANDWFGFHVALDGNTAIIGSRMDDDGANSSGSAYLFNAGPLHSPGDYNQDGLVDAADYVVWRKELRKNYDQSGYTVWRNNFDPIYEGIGALPESADASSIPEPGSATLLLVALIGYQQIFSRCGTSQFTRRGIA